MITPGEVDLITLPQVLSSVTLLNDKIPSNFDNIYIPGFNKKTQDNVFGAGFNYTLTYNFSLLSKKK